jgi:hypothetical protein
MNTLTLFGSAAGQTATKSTSRCNLRSLAKSTVSGIVLASIVATAWKLNQQYDLTGSVLSFAFIFSTLLAIVYRIANPAGWALVLRGFGHQVSIVQATRVWLHAESRRWLPGGVWGYASRAVQAKEIGVPIAVASASMLIELLVTIVAAVVVSTIGVGLYWQQLSAMVQQTLVGAGINSLQFTAAFAVVPLAAAVVYAMRSKLRRKFISLTEKFTALRGCRLRARPLFLSLGYLIVMACLNGLVNFTLLQATSETASVPVIAMIAATAIAWVVGFLAFFSPGGILVREATLAAILLPWLPYEHGFTLAMLSRFAQLIAEIVGILWVFNRDQSA